MASIAARTCASRASGPATTRPAATEIRLSPDGARAVVSLQNRLHVVTVPRAGRETTTIRIAGKSDNAPVPVRRLSRRVATTCRGPPTARSSPGRSARAFHQQALDASAPTTTEVRVEVPRRRPRGSILLTGARIVTMKGDEVIERGDILVTDNRIVAVGRRGSLRPPAGARVVNVAGKTVMPGLVDAHAHMWAPRGLHQTQVWQHLANLAYGVTTTRDPQTSTPDVFAYADLIDAGLMPGPRVYATGPGVFATSGIDSREAAFAFIKRYKEAYGTNTIKQYVAGDRIVRQWIIEACKDNGITATIEGSLDMKLNLTQMADGYSGQEHSFPIQPLYKDVIEFVARTKTFYTPTILVAYGAPWTENYWFENEDLVNDAKLHRWIPRELLDGMIRRRAQWFLPEEYGHTRFGRQVADIVHAGGKAALGSHGQLQGLGAHWETWNLGSGGLTPHETLRVVTLNGAEAIGLQQDLGSLEPGKLADLIVLDGNPLVDLRQTNSLRYVMKNGELFDATTLDLVWPEARPLPTPFWWGTEPGVTPGVAAFGEARHRSRLAAGRGVVTDAYDRRRRARAANPTRPVPSSSIDIGSGTGAALEKRMESSAPMTPSLKDALQAPPVGRTRRRGADERCRPRRRCPSCAASVSVVWQERGGRPTGSAGRSRRAAGGAAPR